MKEIYDWVPWFAELAKRIADGGERYLVERAKNVEWGTPVEEFRLFRYGDENIDPFSFIYTLASRNTTNLREPVFSSVARVFDVPDLFPLDNPEAQTFPTPGSHTNLLFHDGRSGSPDTLWRLLKAAVRGRSDVRKEDFDSALEIRQVAKNKLTQTLFLINGREFFPYDDTMQALGITPRMDGGTFSFEAYMRIMEAVRDVFQDCDDAEINLFAFLQGKLNLNPSQCFVVNTNVDGDGKDYWEDFALNNWVYTGAPKSGTSWQEFRSAKTNGYPLAEPTPGDILLVRTGDRGRGMGIVHENGYKKELSAESKLHVIWINKSERDLSIGTSRGPGFMRGNNQWGRAFREAYPRNFCYVGSTRTK